MLARYCHEAIVLHILPTPWAPANLAPHHSSSPRAYLFLMCIAGGICLYMTRLIGAQPKCQNPFYHHSLYPISTFIIPTLFPIHFHSPLKEIQNFLKLCTLGYGDPTQTSVPSLSSYIDDMFYDSTNRHFHYKSNDIKFMFM